MDSRLNTSEFTSVMTDFGRSARASAARNTEKGRSAHRKDPIHKAGMRGESKFFLRSLLSLCIACFCFVFIFEITGAGHENDAIKVMKNALKKDSDEKDSAEEPGRLKLVELPSIIEIFARGDRPVPPIAMDNAAVDKDSLIAKIYAPAGTEISSVLAGTVKSVNPSSEHGGLVIVSHPNDVDIYYYGLSEISVERGQPVLQGSTIGLLGGDALCLRITKRGEPVDPFEFLGVRAGVG